jgi:hypothetical protein
MEVDRRGDPQQPSGAIGELTHRVVCVLYGLQTVDAALEVNLTSLGQSHASRGSIEQARAHSFFHGRNVFGHRRG